MPSFELGDKVAIIDNSRIGSYMYEYKGINEYWVIGIDDEDRCPCIAYEDYMWYLSPDEIDDIQLASKSSVESRSYVEKTYPYVPPNKEIQYLLLRLLNKNDIMGIYAAIDVALDQRDEKSFDRLVKLL